MNKYKLFNIELCKSPKIFPVKIYPIGTILKTTLYKRNDILKVIDYKRRECSVFKCNLLFENTLVLEWLNKQTSHKKTTSYYEIPFCVDICQQLEPYDTINLINL